MLFPVKFSFHSQAFEKKLLLKFLNYGEFAVKRVLFSFFFLLKSILTKLESGKYADDCRLFCFIILA